MVYGNLPTPVKNVIWEQVYFSQCSKKLFLLTYILVLVLKQSTLVFPCLSLWMIKRGFLSQAKIKWGLANHHKLEVGKLQKQVDKLQLAMDQLNQKEEVVETTFEIVSVS